MTVKDDSGNITGLKMKVKNNTPEEAIEKTDTAPGKFVVSYQYTPAAGGNPVYGISNEVALAESIPTGSESTTEYTFTFIDSNNSPSPIPSDAQAIKYLLVYRGKLGNEEGAVVAGAVVAGY